MGTRHSPSWQPTPGTDIHTVWAALNEFPGIAMTSRELSDETGLSVKTCSGYIYTLRARGLVSSRPSEDRRGHTLEHWVARPTELTP